VRRLPVLLALCVFSAPATARAALISLGLSGYIGSEVAFDGSTDTFEFRNTFGPADFIVISVVHRNDPSYTPALAPAGSLGLTGQIDGTFTIEASQGTATEAPVSGAGGIQRS